MNYEEEEEE